MFGADEADNIVAASRYSETLMLLRGTGVVHVRPTNFDPDYVSSQPPVVTGPLSDDMSSINTLHLHEDKKLHDDGDDNQDGRGPVVINCPFSAQKVNFPFLRTLHRMLNQSVAARATGRGVLLRFFSFFKDKLSRTVFRREVLRVINPHALVAYSPCRCLVHRIPFISVGFVIPSSLF